jgi:hypothetical protein
MTNVATGGAAVGETPVEPLKTAHRGALPVALRILCSNHLSTEEELGTESIALSSVRCNTLHQLGRVPRAVVYIPVITQNLVSRV